MRYLSSDAQSLLADEDKMLFLAGPRQVGKTTFAKSLLVEPRNYLNWDNETHRTLLLRKRSEFHEVFLRTTGAGPTRVVLDEIHKYPLWKRFLKGVYDTTKGELDLIVTGSGRLNVYQRGGDSLFGRYNLLRVHPFTTGELLTAGHQTVAAPDLWLESLQERAPQGAEDALAQIERWTGFPEPLYAQNAARLVRWRRARRDLVFREDLRDLTRIRELGMVEQMTALLPERIGSPLSVNALSEDVGAAYTTVQGWLAALERLYHHFELRPYAGRLARTLRKEAKIYLFDPSLIESDGARFENVVALHLLKITQLWTDQGHGDFALHYIRDKEKRETDFVIVRDRKVWLLLECKLSDTSLDSSLRYFSARVKPKASIQLVRTATSAKLAAGNHWILPAARLLARC
jgi:uncharacterized protein